MFLFARRQQNPAPLKKVARAQPRRGANTNLCVVCEGVACARAHGSERASKIRGGGDGARGSNFFCDPKGAYTPKIRNKVICQMRQRGVICPCGVGGRSWRGGDGFF